MDWGGGEPFRIYRSTAGSSFGVVCAGLPYPAFEETFGMTMDEFYAELDLFLAQPLDQQMEALARE